jgi:hypothetical protein
MMSKEGEGSGRCLTEGIPSINQEVPGKPRKASARIARFRSKYNAGTSQIKAGIILMDDFDTKTGSSKTSS